MDLVSLGLTALALNRGDLRLALIGRHDSK